MLFFFHSRSLKFTYDSTVTVHGIDLYRFTIPIEVLRSGDINPDNKGFCVTGPSKECLPSGLLDVNLCKGGARGNCFVIIYTKLASVYKMELHDYQV